MKGFFSLVMPVLLVLLAAAPATATEVQPDHGGWVSLGTKNSQVSLSFGKRNGTFGWEIGGLNSSDYDSGEVLDYPVPLGGLAVLGDKTVDGSYGIDVLRFAQLSEKLSLYGGVGVYFQEHREIAQSNDTGLLHSQSRRTETNTAYSGGVRFHSRQNLTFGIGYHTVRGTNAQIMVKF